MSSDDIRAASTLDDEVVGQIVASLTTMPPQSFFLYAGAGAGKTRTLVSVLERLQAQIGHRMRLKSQQVGVITYTNAACDEIIHRLKHDSLFNVRTIHSFIWNLIEGFNADIRIWLRANLQKEIQQLEKEQESGRATSKASVERARSIENKRARIEQLDSIRVFTYSPEGDNHDRESLNHSEVIAIGTSFLVEKPLMRQLLVSRYSTLLIDESQDTNHTLIDALLLVQSIHADKFAIGFIGDTMQRIYNEGKADLPSIIPSAWSTPRLRLNHRSPVRVVELINQIRAEVDGVEQKCRLDANDGCIRLFLCGDEEDSHHLIESKARARMAEITGDPLWREPAEVRTLVLEHQMAARRGGFSSVFEPLYRRDKLKSALLKGELPVLRFFTNSVLPIVSAALEGKSFNLMELLRKKSDLLSEGAFRAAGSNQARQLLAVKLAVQTLLELWDNDSDPKLHKILEIIHANNLLPIPDALKPFAVTEEEAESEKTEGEQDLGDRASTDLDAIQECLRAPFSEIEKYHGYVSEISTYETHHGVKGRQFERVLVVINDSEARGPSYKYGSLFGTAKSSGSSRRSSNEEKGSSSDRIRRLFYVTCSRSKNSLAVIVYTQDQTSVQNFATEQSWFKSHEIERL